MFIRRVDHRRTEGARRCHKSPSQLISHTFNDSSRKRTRTIRLTQVRHVRRRGRDLCGVLQRGRRESAAALGRDQGTARAQPHQGACRGHCEAIAKHNAIETGGQCSSAGELDVELVVPESRLELSSRDILNNTRCDWLGSANAANSTNNTNKTRRFFFLASKSLSSFLFSVPLVVSLPTSSIQTLLLRSSPFSFLFLLSSTFLSFFSLSFQGFGVGVRPGIHVHIWHHVEPFPD